MYRCTPLPSNTVSVYRTATRRDLLFICKVTFYAISLKVTEKATDLKTVVVVMKMKPSVVAIETAAALERLKLLLRGQGSVPENYMGRSDY